MSLLSRASVKNLQRKGPPPLSFCFGPTEPWGSLETECVDACGFDHATNLHEGDDQ